MSSILIFTTIAPREPLDTTSTITVVKNTFIDEKNEPELENKIVPDDENFKMEPDSYQGNRKPKKEYGPWPHDTLMHGFKKYWGKMKHENRPGKPFNPKWT